MIFAVFDHDELTDEVLTNGASGYLLHAGDHPALQHAMQALHMEGRSMADPLVRPVMVQMRQEPGHSGLSAREQEVLQCLVDGCSYKMIADALGISFETVRTHIKRIYEKLQVHNNTEAVAKALKRGLLK